MTDSDSPSAKQRLEAALRDTGAEHYVLRLYVAGLTPRSQAAIQNVRALCETHLANRYDLEVIDLYQQPTLAQSEQIIVAPTLVKKLPLPLRKLIGSLADEDKVLVGLDLKPKQG
jgi:circadian clock protein KaiB